MEKNAAAAPKKSNGLFMNPLVRKLSKVAEQSEENAASYRGITTKVIYFMITLIIGIALYPLIHKFFGGGQLLTVSGITMSYVEAVVLGVSALLTILTPLLAFLIRPIIPAAGTLYCAGTGYLITWAAITFGREYTEAVWMALGLTILIVCTMALLYTSGIVKVNKKFKTVVSTLFIVTLLGGLITFLASLVPALHPYVALLTENPTISLVVSAIFVVIASLFLLVDFDTIHQTVENHLPKKYEWLAAFSLTFTIIWLYFKILDLILRAKQDE